MEKESKTSGERGMEVVRVPGYPVVSVVNVGVGVVPNPVQKIHGNYVVRYVNQNGEKTNCKWLCPIWQFCFCSGNGSVVDKAGV